MLHILFLLLRVILIVLAVVVVLIVLILAVPLLYSFQAEKKEDEPFEGQFQLTWFYRLLYLKVSYADRSLDYGLFLFGRQLFGNQPDFKEKRDARRERKAKKKAKKEKKKAKKEKKKAEKEKRKAEKEKEAETKRLEAEKETETKRLETEKETETKRIETDKENEAETEKLEVETEEEGKQSETTKEKTDKTASSGGEKNKKKRSEKRKKKKKGSRSTGRSGSRFSSLLDMGRRGIAFLRGEEGKELLSVAQKSIIKLLRHIMPRKVKGMIRFGFDDPSRTGMVTGLAALFYPRYCRSFTVTPDFMNACFEADCKGRGRIHVGYLVYIVIIVMRNADARKAITTLFRGMI